MNINGVQETSINTSPLQNLQNLNIFTKEEVIDAFKKNYKKINSDDEQAKMAGSYYFAEIRNEEIVAIGNEERNYCGGVLATSKNKEELIGRIDKLKTSYETLKTADERSNIPSWTKEEALLYEKIKDMKISDTYPNGLVMVDKKGPVRSWNE